MLALIRKNKSPSFLRHIVRACYQEPPAVVPYSGTLPSHHILCAGTYSPVFARLAAESALAACPPELRAEFRMFIHVDGVAGKVRANLMDWLREIPGVTLSYGLFGILSGDRIPGKWHQVMLNDICKRFRNEPHLAFLDADLFLVDGSWWRECNQALAEDVYSVSVDLRHNSTLTLGDECYAAIRTNLFTLNPRIHNALNQQGFNKDKRAIKKLQQEFPSAHFKLGNIDTMIGGSLRAQAHGYRVIDVGERVPHCHIGGFSHLSAGKFKDYNNPERIPSIMGLLSQARLLARVLEYFDQRGWGSRVDLAYRENVARMNAFIAQEEKLKEIQDGLPPATREVVFEQVVAATGY